MEFEKLESPVDKTQSAKHDSKKQSPARGLYYLTLLSPGLYRLSDFINLPSQQMMLLIYHW
ncbi:MAG: hypothetical protein JWR12_750 [Mucilaginibacter sp.]|jgi:hypothetical protein|nr:hypothetical protein [Mucilaginibacter sp.]